MIHPCVVGLLVVFTLHASNATPMPARAMHGTFPPPGTTLTTKTYSETVYNIETRDNATLYTRAFFAEGQPAKCPMLYVQCPYTMDFHTAFIGMWNAFINFEIPLPEPFGKFGVGLKMGLIIQETRGRFNSTGEFDLFRLTREDSEDSISWIKKQSWR